jgi:hypothetical protein
LEASVLVDDSGGILLTSRRHGAGLAVVLVAALSLGGVATTGNAVGELPPAGAIVGTLRFPVWETPLFAARADSLFVLVVPPRRAASITVLRVNPSGSVTSRRVPLALSGYLMDVSIGPDGIYAGTAVIKRFTDVPDELVRIDAKTLTIRARASFPSRVAAVERGRRMWASIGDGRVVRLDPRTLAVEASRRLLPATAVRTRGLSLSKPAVGLGSLWVLAGDELDLELVRMDPVSLAVRSKTRVPTRGDLYQALNRVVADSGRIYLVGSAIAGADARGKLLGRPVLVPDLATAEIHGTDLVGLTNEKPALVILNAQGRILARTRLLDAGARLSVSGENAWLLGNGGQGNGIVHLHLASR